MSMFFREESNMTEGMNFRDFMPSDELAAALRTVHNKSDGWWFTYLCTKLAGFHLSTQEAKEALTSAVEGALISYAHWAYRILSEERKRQARGEDGGIDVVTIPVPLEAARRLVKLMMMRLPRAEKMSARQLATMLLQELYQHLQSEGVCLDGGVVEMHQGIPQIVMMAEEFEGT